MIDIQFPLEFLIKGTPVSLQADRKKSRENWASRVRRSCKTVLPRSHLLTDSRLSVTIYYFPSDRMQGDIDNIVKPILDALTNLVYFDDHQIDRVVVQRFEPDRILGFQRPSVVLSRALEGERPVTYMKISSDPDEDLQ